MAALPDVFGTTFPARTRLNSECKGAKDGSEDKEEEYIAAGEEDPELPYAFLSIVNLVTRTAQVLLCGGREVQLAKAAFGGELARCPRMDAAQFEELGASSYLKPGQTMM